MRLGRLLSWAPLPALVALGLGRLLRLVRVLRPAPLLRRALLLGLAPRLLIRRLRLIACLLTRLALILRARAGSLPLVPAAIGLATLLAARALLVSLAAM